MIAMLPSSSLGNEVTFHFLYHLDACRDGCIDVKGELGKGKKCCRIKGFKTNGSNL